MAVTATPFAGNAARPAAEAGLSIVVPLFNEGPGLAGFHARLAEIARGLRQQRGLATEVVYVDDGSRDDSLAVAQALSAEALDIQVISLSRNFGKEAALLAGLDHARLGAVLFMDGDGQHPPALVEKLVGYWLDDGYDVVYTAKAHRASEPWLRRLGVKTFYALINWGARQKIPEDAGDFRLLSPRAAAALRLASLLGLLLAAAAFIFGVQILLETFVFGESVPGYPSVIVGLMVLGGVQLIMIGIMGEYIGKILSQLKARPVYFVAEHTLKTAENADASGGPPPRSAAE